MTLSPDEKNVIFEYYAALKSHCQANTEKGGCPQCDLRLFCHTPACGMTDEMVNMVIDFAYEHNHMDCHDRLDRHSGLFQWPCPCNMDMSSALGFSPR